MKYWTMMMAGLLALTLCASVPLPAVAGGVEKIKEGTREAVSEVKNDAVQAGKAAAETGKEIKEDAVRTGTAIKEGAKEVGQGFKKAYQETRDAVTKEISGDTRNPSDH
jgi:hypothetical protein